MTIHWKAVEQYLTVVLFVNPYTPRVKPWVIQSFLTFDSVVLFVNGGLLHSNSSFSGYNLFEFAVSVVFSRRSVQGSQYNEFNFIG